MKTLHTFITELSNGFISKTRSTGDSFYTFDDSKEIKEVLQEIVRTAHNGLLPHDIIFEICQTILNDMYDRVDEDESNLDDYYFEDTGNEISDQAFRDFPHYTYYCDQVLQESSPTTMSGIEQAGQYNLISEISHILQEEIMELEFDQWETE